MLRELSLWLAAGALNVRAEGALRFPEEQDISELRLSFIRLAPETSPVKLILISLCPMASGLAALGAISATLFSASDFIMLAIPGSVSELGAAIRSFTATADFWLWLYIVFTIANRSFPTLPLKLSARRKSLLMLTPLALSFGLWRAADVANPAIALGIEGLLSGLTLIIAQISLLNIGCVLALGAIEAVIERFTSRSATFRDGRMITFDRGETAPPQARQIQERQNAARASKARQAAPATSIYDLKLPIPGPPGREPISRKAVAVVNLARPAATDKLVDQESAARPLPIHTARPRPDVNDESARAVAKLLSDDAADGSRFAAADHEAVAAFARPFAEHDAPSSASDDSNETEDESGGEPFARPFVMSTRPDQPASTAVSLAAESDHSKADATDDKAANKTREAPTHRGRSRSSSSRSRPAPKPSQKDERGIGSTEERGTDELEYEDLDDVDALDRDDGRYDDEL